MSSSKKSKNDHLGKFRLIILSFQKSYRPHPPENNTQEMKNKKLRIDNAELVRLNPAT